MNENLVKAKKGAEFPTRERVFITERLNDPAVPGWSLADARVEAGVTTELHRLSVGEWYVLQEGSGMMEVGDGEPFAVGPGDTVVIPSGVSQRIANTGDGNLLLQCICIPRFTPDCYEALENELD